MGKHVFCVVSFLLSLLEIKGQNLRGFFSPSLKYIKIILCADCEVLIIKSLLGGFI
jgi:hypothetical protein